MWSIKTFELDGIWSPVVFEPSVPILSGLSTLSASIDVILETSLCIDLLKGSLGTGVLRLAAASPGGSRCVLSGTLAPGMGIGPLWLAASEEASADGVFT